MKTENKRSTRFENLIFLTFLQAYARTKKRKTIKLSKFGGSIMRNVEFPLYGVGNTLICDCNLLKTPRKTAAMEEDTGTPKVDLRLWK